jgi:hypothetical protein
MKIILPSLVVGFTLSVYAGSIKDDIIRYDDSVALAIVGVRI